MMLVLHRFYTTRFTEVGRWLWPRTLTKAIKGFAHICQHCSLLVSDFVGFLLTRIAAATIIGFWYLLGYALCLFLGLVSSVKHLSFHISKVDAGYTLWILFWDHFDWSFFCLWGRPWDLPGHLLLPDSPWGASRQCYSGWKFWPVDDRQSCQHRRESLRSLYTSINICLFFSRL